MIPKIRPMTPEDKPAIMQILKAIPEFKPAEVIVAEEVIDSYLKDLSGSGYHIFVAEIDDSYCRLHLLRAYPIDRGNLGYLLDGSDPRNSRVGV